MGRIDEATMDNVELLAKLSLSAKERKRAMAEMEKLLTYVEKLSEVDTAGVEPMVHILPQVNVFREDIVVNGDGREALMQNAPKSKNGQLIVPKTIIAPTD